MHILNDPIDTSFTRFAGKIVEMGSGLCKKMGTLACKARIAALAAVHIDSGPEV
jgi:hypothetical protein